MKTQKIVLALLVSMLPFASAQAQILVGVSSVYKWSCECFAQSDIDGRFTNMGDITFFATNGSYNVEFSKACRALGRPVNHTYPVTNASYCNVRGVLR